MKRIIIIILSGVFVYVLVNFIFYVAEYAYLNPDNIFINKIISYLANIPLKEIYSTPTMLFVISFLSIILYPVIGNECFKNSYYPLWYKIVYQGIVFAIIYLATPFYGFIFSVIFYLIVKLIIYIDSKIELKRNMKKIIIEKERIINLPFGNVNMEELIKQSFDTYKELQIAFMDFDYKKIKELVSDEIYNECLNKLNNLKTKHQKNIVSDIEFIEGYIISYKRINEDESFKVYISLNCYNYIINIDSNEVVSGNKNKKIILNYILTFERKNKIINYCPKCGYNITNLIFCPSCKFKIVNNTSKLKMTKKQIITQK